MRPLVSTLIPVGPGSDPRWLRVATDSTFAQQDCEHQVLICLDGFATNHPIIREIDPRCQIVHHEINRGVAHSLNALITLADGDFIARLDADDRSLSGRYFEQHRLIEEGYDIVGSGMVMEGTYVAPPCHDTKMAKRLVRLCKVPIYHPTLFAKRNVFDGLQYPVDYPHCEDYAFHCLGLNLGLTYCNVVGPFVDYRLHEGQMSRLHRAEQLANTTRALKDFNP